MTGVSATGVRSRRELIVLILILGGISSVGAFAIDMYLPALPTVAADLHASAAAIELSVTTFLIGLALGQLLAGSLSDMFGRRRPVLTGLAVFAASSAVCAVAQSATVLVAVRGLQGLSGAFGLAIANAVVTNHFRGREAARFLSRLALVSLTAPIIAPLIGGLLLRVTTWHAIFVVLAVVGLVLLVAVAVWLPESLPREGRLPGSLRASAGVMSRLSRDRLFMGFALSAAFPIVAFFGYLAASSFILQDIYGATPTQFSVLFSLNAVGLLSASQLNHFLLKRTSPRRLLLAAVSGAAVAACAMLVMVLVGGLGLLAVAAPLFVIVSALGMVTPDATALALSLHPDVAGSASSYFGTLRLGLGALASPLVAVGGVSARSFSLVIAGACVLAVIAYAVLVAGRHPPSPETCEEAEVEIARQIQAG